MRTAIAVLLRPFAMVMFVALTTVPAPADPAPVAPRLATVIPLAGIVHELTSIIVTFNEPVTGVRAVDFLLNGVPADGVIGTGTTYTFTFAQPAYGPVDITWGTLHSIADMGDPSNRFDGGV